MVHFLIFDFLFPRLFSKIPKNSPSITTISQKFCKNLPFAKIIFIFPSIKRVHLSTLSTATKTMHTPILSLPYTATPILRLCTPRYSNMHWLLLPLLSTALQLQLHSTPSLDLQNPVKTLSLAPHNATNSFYAARLSIGTPPQQFDLALYLSKYVISLVDSACTLRTVELLPAEGGKLWDGLLHGRRDRYCSTDQ